MIVAVIGDYNGFRECDIDMIQKYRKFNLIKIVNNVLKIIYR